MQTAQSPSESAKFQKVGIEDVDEQQQSPTFVRGSSPVENKEEQKKEASQKYEAVWIEGEEQDLTQQVPNDVLNEKHCASFHELELRDGNQLRESQ